MRILRAALGGHRIEQHRRLDLVERVVELHLRLVVRTPLRGRRALVACAIGNPGAFVADVRAAGAEVVGTVRRRDHHAFTADEVERLARDAGDADIVLTGKDWAKVGPLVESSRGRARDARWWVPRASIAFHSGEERVRDSVLAAASRASRP